MQVTMAKTALGIVSLLLVLSMGGGFLLLPVLVPLHIWAARRSGPVGRAGWSLLPVITAGMVSWAAVYVAVGEGKPAIWLVPLCAAAAAVPAILRATATAARV